MTRPFFLLLILYFKRDRSQGGLVSASRVSRAPAAGSAAQVAARKAATWRVYHLTPPSTVHSAMAGVPTQPPGRPVTASTLAPTPASPSPETQVPTNVREATPPLRTHASTAHSCKRPLTLTLFLFLFLSLFLSLSLTRARVRSLTHTYTRARARTHTHTHKHFLPAVSTPQGEKTLREAAEKGSTSEVARLLENGVNPNCCDEVCNIYHTPYAHITLYIYTHILHTSSQNDVCVCVCVCMCVCVCVNYTRMGMRLDKTRPRSHRIYVRVYVCMYMYTYAYMYTHIHTYTHTHIHTYAYICIHIHAYMHTCIHTYIHTYIHACMHAYMHTCIHI